MRPSARFPSQKAIEKQRHVKNPASAESGRCPACRVLGWRGSAATSIERSRRVGAPDGHGRRRLRRFGSRGAPCAAMPCPPTGNGTLSAENRGCAAAVQRSVPAIGEQCDRDERPASRGSALAFPDDLSATAADRGPPRLRRPVPNGQPPLNGALPVRQGSSPGAGNGYSGCRNSSWECRNGFPGVHNGPCKPGNTASGMCNGFWRRRINSPRVCNRSCELRPLARHGIPRTHLSGWPVSPAARRCPPRMSRALSRHFTVSDRHAGFPFVPRGRRPARSWVSIPASSGRLRYSIGTAGP